MLYLLTAAGRLTSLDGIAMYRTAHRLVVAGQVAVPPSPEAPAGRDGRHYAKYGLGQSLVELPLVLLGHTLATLTNQPDDRLTQFWASLTNTFVSVGIVLVWWRFARDLGYTRPVATAGAVTLASASLLWPYARTDFSEPLLALALLSTAWCLYRWHCAPPRAWAWALAAGACGGFAFVTKPTAAILCPAFALYALWLLRSGGRSWVSGLRSLSTSLGPLVVAGGFVLAFNYYRFGSVLDLGYGDEPVVRLYYAAADRGGAALGQLRQGAAVVLSGGGGGTVGLARVCARASSASGPRSIALRVSAGLFRPLVGLARRLVLGAALSGGDGPVPHVGLAATLATRAPQTALLPRGARRRHRSDDRRRRECPRHPRRLQARTTASSVISLGQGADVADARTEPAFSPLAGHWWLLRAALYDALGDDDRDPLANPFLHAYPWAEAFPDRVPPHPEYAVKLDLWFAGPDDRPAWVEFVSALVAWWLLVALIPAGRALWSAARPASPTDRLVRTVR